METSPANTTTDFTITLVLLSKRSPFLSPRPRLPIQLSFHCPELGVNPSGLIKSGAHFPVYVVRAAPFRVRKESREPLSLYPAFTGEQGFNDWQANNRCSGEHGRVNGLHRRREWSRDCASMERWSDDTYNGMTGKKHVKAPNRHVPLSCHSRLNKFSVFKSTALFFNLSNTLKVNWPKLCDAFRWPHTDRWGTGSFKILQPWSTPQT